MRRVIVLGGLGFFGRAAAAQLRRLGVHVRTASRGGGADLRIDANDPESIRAAVRPGNIVLDAAGPFHGRSLALVEMAIRVGFDVVDLNDDLQYAELVLSRAPQIAEAGIRVLCSASTVSAFAAAVMRIIGPTSPRRLTSFLMPATRHTANAGTATALLRTVGQPIRILRSGELRTVLGWRESRTIRLPSPLRAIRGHLFESADALWLPRICPSLKDVAMYVDANTLGANAMLTMAAHSRIVRHMMQRGLGFGTRLARRFGAMSAASRTRSRATTVVRPALRSSQRRTAIWWRLRRLFWPFRRWPTMRWSIVGFSFRTAMPIHLRYYDF